MYTHANLLQGVPTPEKEFAEHTFKTEICIEKSPTDAGSIVKEIAKHMTAFMNTSGGLILLYSNIPGSDKARDNWIMGFESHLKNNWIPESLLQALVRYQYLEKDGQLCIYIFVSKSPHLVTFEFHAYGRLATCVSPIKDIQRVQAMIHEPQECSRRTECPSQMRKLLPEDQAFSIGYRIPVEYRESETMEFKHCYCGTSQETSEKTELPWFTANELKRKLGDHLKYLSAFANTQGGSLVLGVEETGEFPVVRGFPVTPNQKAAESQVTKYLKKRLEKCIWHGDPDYKPVMGQDWGVVYHKVIADDGGERKMIEVRIAKHSGGMFLQSPAYYVVDKDGKTEEKKDFSDWSAHFQDIAATSHSDTTDTQQDLRKHTESEGTEINSQANRDNPVLSAPKDQPQPVTAVAAIETKVPRFFKESDSEYKTDILVQGLSMHDCCTIKMSQHIKSLQRKGDKVWFPPIDHIRQQLPNNAHCDKLITFLQAKEQNWLASLIETDKQPDTAREYDVPGWMCYLLLLGEQEPPLLMCCVGRGSHCDISKQDMESLVADALNIGRVLKRIFLAITANQQHQSCLFHFDIEVLLVPAEGDVKVLWKSREKQPVTYPGANQETQYTIACNGLAEELLRNRASSKDRYGQILTEHLTEAQARVLHAERRRVLIVTGKSGTGKTVIALHLAKEATKEESSEEDVVYICNGAGLTSFIRFQVSCPVLRVNRTNVLSSYQKAMLQKATLILVDDVHAIQLDEHWKSNKDDLYRMLFMHSTKPKTRVAIFFDPEQDYKGNLPKDFDKRLRDLAETVPGALPQDVSIVALNERIRNSQEVNRFMQANQNQANITGTIECLNESPGDDVIYEYIGSNMEESAKFVNAKLDFLEAKYGARSVVILCDDHEQMNEMKTILTEQFNRSFQDENEYPIQHTVICSIEDFGGLEAEVILFLLPRNFGADDVKVSWKYVNVISSRAKERLEFLLPWKPENERGPQERLGKFRKLFKTVRWKPVNVFSSRARRRLERKPEKEVEPNEHLGKLLELFKTVSLLHK